MLNVHVPRDSNDGQEVYRIITKTRFKMAEREWTMCPRCKGSRLIPENMGVGSTGSGYTIWWICENVTVCQFPLDMPMKVYCVEQSQQQANDQFIPLPRIFKLPVNLRHLYPLTFPAVGQERSSSSRALTCDSGVSNSNDSNGERSDSTCPSIISDESSVGVQRLKSLHVGGESEVVADDSERASTSADGNDSGSTTESTVADDLDREIESEIAQKKPVRVVKRKQYGHGSMVLTKRLIENIARDKQFVRDLLNIEESQLFERLKGILEDLSLKRYPAAFSLNRRAVSFKLDEIEDALRRCPFEADWKDVRKKIGGDARTVGIYTQAIKFAPGGKQLLDAVGAKYSYNRPKTDYEEKEVLTEKIERILSKLEKSSKQAAAPAPKKQKSDDLEETRRAEEASASEKKVKENAKARVLSRLRNKRQPAANPVNPKQTIPSTSYDVPVPQVVVTDPQPVHDAFADNWEQEFGDVYTEYQPIQHEPVTEQYPEEEPNFGDMEGHDNFDFGASLADAQDNDEFVFDMFGI